MPVPVMDRFDRKIIASVAGQDGQPVALWPIVNGIVYAEGPAGRTERRRLVGRVLCRARVLLRRGIIVREGKAHVRLREPVKPPVPAPPAPPKPVTPSVGDLGTFHGGGPRARRFRV